MNREMAIISSEGLYRYLLTRECPGEGSTTVVMINPSTADDRNDDPTIRKIKGFGTRHNWGLVQVVNLFAFRATDVRELRSAADPIGPDNDEWIWTAACMAKQIIVAWGSIGKIPPALRNRVAAVFADLECAKVPILSIGEPTICGQPKHPLFQAYSEPLQPWSLR